MAKAKQKTKTGLSWKRKKWFEVTAPAIWANKVIGEAFAETADDLVGRSVVTNLMELTGNVKKQNILVRLAITALNGSSATTEVRQFSLQTQSVKRLVRKGRSKVEDSFVCMTKDEKKVRVKPLLVTRGRISAQTACTMRVYTRQYLVNLVADMTFDDFVSALCAFKIQKDLKPLADKISPVKQCQIRVAELETSPRVAVVPVAELPTITTRSSARAAAQDDSAAQTAAAEE